MLRNAAAHRGLYYLPSWRPHSSMEMTFKKAGSFAKGPTPVRTWTDGAHTECTFCMGPHCWVCWLPVPEYKSIQNITLLATKGRSWIILNEVFSSCPDEWAHGLNMWCVYWYQLRGLLQREANTVFRFTIQNVLLPILSNLPIIIITIISIIIIIIIVVVILLL